MNKKLGRQTMMVWLTALPCCWMMLSLAGCAWVLGIEDLPEVERPVDAASPPVDGSPSPDAPRFEPPWWNAEFRARVPITVASPPTIELLEDVPVLVVLDAERVDYARASGDGRDLRFVDERGTELAYEIEHWDASGRSFVWVRVPEIASGASTTLWMYHDNPAAQAPGGSVWSDDYLAVWHLAEDTRGDGSGVMHRDATGRGNDGVQNGNGFAGPDSGAIGGAQVFDGSGDFIEIREDGLQETGAALTLLARVYVDDEPNDFSFALGSGRDSDARWQIAWSRETNAWTGRVDTAETFAISVSSEQAALQRWYLVAMVYDGAEARLYVDGEPLGNLVTATGNLRPLTRQLYIGNNQDESRRELDGIVDEVRIAKVARSHSWLRVQHASMEDDLLDFGPAECLGGC